MTNLIMLEIKRSAHHPDMRQHCLMFLANLLKTIGDNKTHIETLLRQNLLSVLNDELNTGHDHAYSIIIIFACLTMIFKALPEEQNKYLNMHGTEAIEQQQYS